MKTKVVFVLVPALTEHGGVRKVLELSNSLAETEKVKIYCAYTRSSIITDIADDVSIVVLSKEPKRKIHKLFLFLILGAYFYLSVLYYRYMHSERVTAIYTHMLTWPISTIVLSERRIFFWQGDELKVLFSEFIYKKLLVKLYSKTFKRAKMFTFSDNLVKTYRFLNVTPVRMWISPIFFNTPVIEKEKNYDCIIFASAEPHKRVEVAIDAVSANASLMFAVVSRNRTVLKRFSNFKNCEVYCPESDKNLIGIIDRSKSMLFTSNYEGFGLPPLECMARGVPCIYFPADTLPPYIDEHNSIKSDTVMSIESCIKTVSETSFKKGSVQTAHKYKGQINNVHKFIFENN